MFQLSPEKLSLLDISHKANLIKRVIAVYFELNGQPRSVDVKDNSIAVDDLAKEIADPSNIEHVAAPIPGLLVDVSVTEGIKVQKGAKLCTIEAMKMETVIYADQSGTVERLCVKAGENIEAQQLLFVIK